MNNPQWSFPISVERLARLWPNREHESNWLKALCCRLGRHRWHVVTLEVGDLRKNVEFCRWCPKMKVGGEVFN